MIANHVPGRVVAPALARGIRLSAALGPGLCSFAIERLSNRDRFVPVLTERTPEVLGGVDLDKDSFRTCYKAHSVLLNVV